MLLAPERTTADAQRDSKARLPKSTGARQVIRSYILENFLFSDDETAIADDESFLELGIIDSVGALEIALFLEHAFGFTVKEDEMLPENLDSVNNLVAFVERRLAEGSGAAVADVANVAIAA
jgi:acyl carrier protein